MISTGKKKTKKTGDSRRNIWLIILTTLLVVASCILFIPPQDKIHQGLDLKGGLSVVLTAKSTDNNAINDATMNASRDIIESRVNALGASEASVTVQGNDQILVQIPGMTDASEAIAAIGRTGELVFARLDSFSDEQQQEISMGLIAQTQDSVEVPKQDLGIDIDENGNVIHHDEEEEATISEDEEATTETVDLTSYKDAVNVSPEDYTPLFDGSHLTSVNIGKASETGADYSVVLKLDGEATSIFGKATTELAPTKGQIVIILDGVVQSAPAVQTAITNGDVSITGNYTRDEALAMKTILESGSLPVSFETSTATVVGPTLGQDALLLGALAAAIGLLLVILYLFFYYKGLGMIAALSMLVFSCIYLGILAALSMSNLFSLSLAGIAGIVLTIGMAADSSILTLERFREEIALGKSIKQASIKGVSHAIRTSIDADIVSLISAGCLFFIGVAQVKGFGLTLGIGILCDIIMMLMFKAPFIRLLAPKAIKNHPGVFGIKDVETAAEAYEELAQAEKIPSIEAARSSYMMSPSQTAQVVEKRSEDATQAQKVMDRLHNLKGRFIKKDINFIGHMKVFLSVSLILVIASAGVIGFKGLSLSSDFVGGTQVTVTNVNDVTENDIDTAYSNAGINDIAVQTTNSSDGEGYIIKTSDTDAENATAVASQVANELGIPADNMQVSTIGPSWGQSILQTSLIALLVSFVLVICYIAIRFKDIKMGAIAIVALIHDILITLGIYALVGHEVTPNVIAALLTILGYSLYDTVVVFHRINDNMEHLSVRCSLKTMANHSLTQVFTRSINTSLTSVLPVICMLVICGGALADFAFAMAVGLVIGMYSSIGLATPLYVLWKGTEPDVKKMEAKYPELGEYQLSN